MDKRIIIIILLLLLLGFITCNRENFDVNLTMRGLNIDPLFIPVPTFLKPYLGYTNYSDELVEVCPSIQKKEKGESVNCTTRSDCGPAEVCINDGVRTYCQCSISNDCIASGVC